MATSIFEQWQQDIEKHAEKAHEYYILFQGSVEFTPEDKDNSWIEFALFKSNTIHAKRKPE